MKFNMNKPNINLQSSYLKDYAEEILYKGKENVFFSEERLVKVLKSIDNMLIKLNNEGYDLTLDDEKNIVLYVGKICNLIIHNNYDMIEERDFFKLLEVCHIELFIYEYSKMEDTYYGFYYLKSFYNIFNNRFDQMNSESTYNVDRWINIIEQVLISCSSAGNAELKIYIKKFVEFAITLRTYYVNDNAYIASLEKYISTKYHLCWDINDEYRQKKYLELVQKETGVYNYESDYRKINGNDIAFCLKELERYNKLLDETKQKMKNLENKIKSIDETSNEYENSFNKLKMDLLSNTKKELIQIFDNQLSSISDTATKESKNIQDEVSTIKKDMLDIFNKKTVEINKEWKLINQMLSMLSKELTDKLLSQETVVLQNSNEKTHKINEKDNIANNFSDIQQIIYSEPIFYLRNDIPLKVRLELLYPQKDSTKLYHKKFDQVVKSVLNNDIVYLVGPSGSGKTTLAQQIAQTLNLPLYNIGYVVDEFLQIRGVMDANSNFIESLFYHAFKGGGICFFDEFDASESKALIELNKIFGSGEFQPYTFANGETVKANPNFRIITAGNTWGDGLTFANNTRGKLDDATMNRCTMYEVYYDEQLEKGIMDKYPDIYEALITLRHYYEETDSPYVITTRDMSEFAQKLDTGCFDLDEIIVTKILKNKRNDTVERMSEALENSGCNDFARRLRKCKKL